MQTTELTRTLDGTRFHGQVPYTLSEEHPDLGEIFDARDLEIFEAKIVQQIFSRRLIGPQLFRFCRSFCALSMRAVADLLQVTRRTVQRWETDPDRPVPPWAMFLVATMADERSKGLAAMRTRLQQLGDTDGRPAEIDIDAA